MLPLYIFAIIIQGVFSAPPCNDGVEIVLTETQNPEDLIGNWTFAYYWDPKIQFTKEFLDKNDYQSNCPQLNFEAITPELVKAKEAECAKHKIPFKWADAKLKVDSPALTMKDGIITIGEKENWMAMDCTTMTRVVIRKAEDYIAMVNSDKNYETELMVRELPTLDEMKCVAHNLDVGKGVGVCFLQ